ncbi:hypothetical protein D3C72_1933820 [compost metagenome]
MFDCFINVFFDGRLADIKLLGNSFVAHVEVTAQFKYFSALFGKVFDFFGDNIDDITIIEFIFYCNGFIFQFELLKIER